MRVLLLAVLAHRPLVAQQHLYQTDAFAITDTSVRQDEFRAIATSDTRIVSNYQRAAVEVNFKFSINGLDNEHPPGSDYMIYLRPRDGRIVTPVYRFGVLEPASTPAPQLAASSVEEGETDVTFRLDLRQVLDALRTTGSYKPPNGEPIARADFRGVYVIGNVAPLSWDFSRLVPGAPMQLHDPDGDGIYEVTLRFNASFGRPLDEHANAVWQLQRDISAMPRLSSPQRLVDALHNLALEELRALERPDGTLNAGGRWPGVWTRDLAWSTLLGVIFVAPDAVKKGLLTRVDSTGRIIQDSGTGGSWPFSTDRVAWSLAAWEYYALTGDTAWLRIAHDIIRRSAEADLVVAFDSVTGLFRGESTFLDWREQSYPRWLDAKDIGTSAALGTNALHHASYAILARMARLLGEPADRWQSVAAAVRRGMNQHLWQPERSYYGQFLYGRLHPVLSPRAEMLGNALSMLAGVADSAQRTRIVERTPVVPFGVPSFWPYIPDVPSYHNAGIWPQVVGFHAWAAADAANGPAVEHALASLYRAAALFLTNKENWVATTGHFEGTEVNSDRFQASAAAQLATNYRVLFGIRLAPDRMILRPFVPRAYAGTRTLSNLRYRNARLTIVMHGFGSGIAEARLDGRRITRAEVPATLSGAHTLEITLNGQLPQRPLTMVGNRFTPATPRVASSEGRIAWQPVEGATEYTIYQNGSPQTRTSATHAPVPVSRNVVEYQVSAHDSAGFASFLSEPIRVVAANAVTRVTAASAPVRTSADTSAVVSFTVAIAEPGDYAIDVWYANGNGAISYGDRASTRTLLVDGASRGTLLFPQRGINRWDSWGYSNAIVVRLEKGPQIIGVGYRPANANMNRAIDYAVIDHLRIAPVTTGH